MRVALPLLETVVKFRVRLLRLAATFALVFCALCFTRQVAFAQTAPTEIEVRVTDASGKPLSNARVFVAGADATSALTPANGILRFGDVQAGIYRVQVSLKGYDGASIAEFEALPGRRAIVDVTLERTATAPAHASSPAPRGDSAREIGRVRARPPVSVRTVDVDEDSPIRRISENLSDALNSIAGVSVAGPSSGNTLTVSIRNGAASQTVNTIGGAAVGGAAAPTLQAVAADLATGVSADTTSSLQSVGGSVNFRTLEPTKTWQQQFSSSYGTYEKSTAQLSLTGSYKKLGVAMQYATRGGDSVITGLRFLDTSGESYVHDGASSRNANFIKLRYALNPRLTLSTSYLSGSTRTATLCTTFLTEVPCGYGPGGIRDAFSSLVNARIQGQIGNVTTNLTVSHNVYSSIDDESQRQFLGVASPLLGSGSQVANSLNSYTTVGVGRHTFALSAGGSWGSGLNSTGGAFAGSTPTAYRYSYYVLADTLKLSDRFSVQVADGINARLASSSNAADIAIDWTPSNAESIGLGTGSYGGGTLYNGGTLFSDPADAIYNCGGENVTVNGYSDPSTPGTYHSLSIFYSRRGKHGSFQVQTYTTREDNASEDVQIPGAAFASSLYPPGYVTAIAGYWQNPLLCGSRPFTPSAIYVGAQIAGLTEQTRGVNANGQLQVGRAVVVQGSYSLDSTVLVTSDPRLMTPGSTYRVGAQLPGRPLHKGNLLIDALQQRARREWVANAAWVGGNNSNSIPGYVVVSAGVTQTLSRGRLSFFANNLFNVGSGIFATSDVAQPIPTVGGGTFLPTPTLLQPRTYTILYSVRSGRLK